MIKRLLQVGLVLAGFASMPSWAILLTDGVTDVGGVDIVLETTTALSNSGEATETAWVNEVLTNLGVDTTSLLYDYKIGDSVVLATNTTDVFAMDLTVSPPAPSNIVADYYIIKNSTTWALFDNETEMGWAVVDVSNPLLADMKIPNDWEVSHITVFSNVSVPEPSILALMGLGLLGVVFTRRRKLNA